MADPSPPPAKRARQTGGRASQKVKRASTLRNLKQITPVVYCPHPCGVECMASTDNMRWLLTGGSDGVVRKYDFFGSLNGKCALQPRQKCPTAPDVVKGGLLLSEWSTISGRKTGGPKGAAASADTNLRPSPVTAIVAESEGVWCLTGTKQGQMHLWTVRTDEGMRHSTLDGHEQQISDIKLLPDEKACVSASWDGSLIHWDLNRGLKCGILNGHTSQITSLSVHSGGQYVLSGSMDGSAKLWDLRTARVQRTLQPTVARGSPAWVMAVCWSVDGNVCYCGKKDGGVDEWDVAQALLRRNVSVRGDVVTSVRALPNSKHIVCGGRDVVRVWDLHPELESRPDHRAPPSPTMTLGCHQGMVSSILVDNTMQYMVTASGTRGWQLAGADNCMIIHAIHAVA